MSRAIPLASRTSSRSLPFASSRRLRRRGIRPILEPMEERALLSIYVVNTVSDLDRAGGLPLGQESLRQAIEDVSGDTTPDTIDFDLGGGGHQVIMLTGALPPITNTATIDGTSQPGYAGKPLVEINGNGLDINILTLQAGHCVVSGLVLNNLGIDISDTAIQFSGDDAIIQASYIGTDWTGSNAAPAGIGIGLQATGCLVGGTTSGAGNVISGNVIGIDDTTGGNTIQGNLIGTDATGTTALGNDDGIHSKDDLIGGATPAARNIISANADDGVFDTSDVAAMGGGSLIENNYIGTDITGTIGLGNGLTATSGDRDGLDLLWGEGQTVAGNVVSADVFGMNVGWYTTIQGNEIGTNASGTAALGNVYGINTDHGASQITLIGGTAPGQGNLISGNTFDGIQIGTGGVVVQGNKIGTDITGTAAIPNRTGIQMSGGTNLIGDTDPGAGNLISGNTFGISGYNGLIQGNLIGTDVTGTLPLGNLTGISAGNDTIGGTTSASRNIISGNSYDVGGSGDIIEGNYIGTDITGENVIPGGGYGVSQSPNETVLDNLIATNNVAVFLVRDSLFQGNLIDVNKEGTRAIGSGQYALAIGDSGNTIGGATAGAGNLIEGATYLFSSNAFGNVFQGNDFGTDATGTVPIGNGAILLTDGAHDNLIGGTTAGAGNIIGQVSVADDSQGINSDGEGNAVLGNSIYASPSQDKPIFLGEFINGSETDVGAVNHPAGTVTGSNGAQNHPVLIAAYAGAASDVVGTLNSTAGDTFRIEFFASPSGDPPGQGRGIRYIGDTSVTTDSNGDASFNVPGLGRSAVGEEITATATVLTGPDANSTSEFSFWVAAVQIPTTTVLTSSASTSSFGQALTLTASVTPNIGSGTPMGSVDFFDSTTGTDLGTSVLSGGVATLSTSALPVGSQSITATYGGDDAFLPSSATTVVLILPSIFVLDPKAAGALTLSGNALIDVPGTMVVDSSSSSALSAAGNAQVIASAIDVVGGVKLTGNAALHATPATGVAAVADPLAGLPSPSPAGLTSYGSVSLSGNASRTICPGIYTQISASGNASLFMNPGIYIIEGGGFTVTGNASVHGSGVMIDNAGSNYPSSGGNFGGITISGNGTVSLTAATSGTCADILIFQSRQNTRALSFSGNAMAGMSGTIYAASALLSMSGNASLRNPLDVGMLNLSGNVTLTQSASGSDGSGDAAGLPDTLLAGNLSVYVSDPGGLFSADELARIQDAIGTWDTLLVPYNVTITEVADPTLANLVIDTSSTSVCGGATDGVLGCYDGSNAEITILQGCSWYAGADPGQIGADQYDFQTTVTHELGHALGLGHSVDTASPMYPTIAAGATDRAPTTQDLNIPDTPDGADPQRAAGFRSPVSSPFVRFVPRPVGVPIGPVAMGTIGSAPAGHEMAATVGSSSGIGPRNRFNIRTGDAGRRPTSSEIGQVRPVVLQAALVDPVVEGLGALSSLLDADPEGVRRLSTRNNR